MAFLKDDTSAKVVVIIADKLSIPPANVKPEMTFKDLGADSLDVVEIIMNFEESFGIEIKDEDAEKIKTIAQAAPSSVRPPRSSLTTNFKSQNGSGPKTKRVISCMLLKQMIRMKKRDGLSKQSVIR